MSGHPLGTADPGPRGPAVSVVIPVYNRCELLALTLRSLLVQTVPANQFEVIVVDDGSDGDCVGTLSARFAALGLQVRLVHHERNRGRASARNSGILASGGDLIIFLDSDMLVPPYFVANHLAAHSHPGRVVTAPLHWLRVWTHLYPGLDAQQLGELREVAGRHREFFLRLCGRATRDGLDPAGVLRGEDEPTQPLPLVSESEVARLEVWKLVYTPAWSEPYTGVISRQHGENLDGFGMPWIALVTGNCSIERGALLDAGGFDETFCSWGFEDYELGYRLHQLGMSFHCLPGVEAAHQNHPVDRARRRQAVFENYALFVARHPDLPLFLLGLAIDDWNRLHTLGVAAHEFELARERARRSRRLKQSLQQFEATVRQHTLQLLIDHLGSGVLDRFPPELSTALKPEPEAAPGDLHPERDLTPTSMDPIPMEFAALREVCRMLGEQP